MNKKVLVIKLGSAILTNSQGNIDASVIQKITTDISNLIKDYKVVLVSSGAVSSGKKYLKNYKGLLNERKAAAAIGNPILIELYRNHFKKRGLTVAQALCERTHFSNRKQFLQLRETFTTFWSNDIVPIVNENDVISNLELKFSDNDELAALLAIGFDAEALLLCTSVGGFLNHSKEIIKEVNNINQEILSLVTADTSNTGLGGMTSKLTFTRLTTSLGIKVIMCGLNGNQPFTDALNRKNGTWFMPQKSNLKNRQKWLASGSITLGTLQVDAGAVQALLQRKSLLTVGIANVIGNFEANEVVQIMNNDDEIIAVARVRFNASQIKDQLNTRNIIAAHANDIVLL